MFCDASRAWPSNILLDEYVMFLDIPYHLQRQKRGNVHFRHEYPYRCVFDT